MTYKILFSRSARKELDNLEKIILRRIFSKIEALSENPRPKGSRKLRSRKYLWRIRIGDYRVIYSVNDKEKLIDVIIIRHRREAYK